MRHAKLDPSPDPANANGMVWEIPITIPTETCTNCTLQLVQAMEESATQDLRGVKDLPIVLRALGKPKSKRLRAAVRLLRRTGPLLRHRACRQRNEAVARPRPPQPW